MKGIRVVMYARGAGSGHVTRISSVYKGFIRAGIPCDFFAALPSTAYSQLVDPAINLCEAGRFPERIDVFICDWRSDEFTDSLPADMARVWIGLRRLEDRSCPFPTHYTVVAIEPGVAGNVCFWPIISTWPDELISREEVRTLLNLQSSARVGLLCENGASASHVEKVFTQGVPTGVHRIKCSNNRFAAAVRDLNYYPIARLFRGVDFLVVGGGYNSVHEALSYANLTNTKIVNAGVGDQALRLQNLTSWEAGRGSRSHELAGYIMAQLNGGRC